MSFKSLLSLAFPSIPFTFLQCICQEGQATTAVVLRRLDAAGGRLMCSSSCSSVFSIQQLDPETTSESGLTPLTKLST